MDYKKVDSWDYNHETTEVDLFDSKGKKVDSLSLDNLVEAWLEQATA